MPFAAILDASVLYPLPLRDTLLRVAEIELYDPYWSERILAEVTRNLILDRRTTEKQASNMTNAMRGAFDSATVPEDAIAQLESAMANDPKNRHVLAAAVTSDAQAVVTLNLKHFPNAACEPLAIEPLHPDNFLLDLYSLDGSESYRDLSAGIRFLDSRRSTVRNRGQSLGNVRAAPRRGVSGQGACPVSGRTDGPCLPANFPRLTSRHSVFAVFLFRI